MMVSGVCVFIRPLVFEVIFRHIILRLEVVVSVL